MQKPFTLILFLLLSTRFNAQPNLVFTPAISSGLTSPIEFVNAGDGSGRVFIVQQGGTIRVYNSSLSFLNTFLTVSDVLVGGEQGLLSMAFHPDYENPDPAIGGFFYVYYTNLSGNLELARYHVSSGDPNLADPLSKQVVLTIDHPGQSNHNGAKLNFGTDGYLYFATGDGGGGGDIPNNAQNPLQLLGKMLRINVTNSSSAPFYTIPADNPWAGVQTPVDTADAIWAFGLRNPFRWSFDRLNQAMWIGDVGQGAWEEINYRAAGTHRGINYGWRCYEGNAPYNTSGCGPITNYIFPVYVYANGPGSAAVTGGVVYRGSEYPSLYGYYFASDVYSGIVYVINASTLLPATRSGPTFIVNYGETEAGEVYAVSLAGAVYRLAPGVVVPVTLVSFSAHSKNGVVMLNWKTATELNTQDFTIEFSTNGYFYNDAGVVAARNAAGGSAYQFSHLPGFNGKVYYRLKITDLDGRTEYSSIVEVDLKNPSKVFIHPSRINDGLIHCYTNKPNQIFELFQVNGALILRKELRSPGFIQIPLPKNLSGYFIAVLQNQETKIVQKIFISQ